jgi:hypothetical protein
MMSETSDTTETNRHKAVFYFPALTKYVHSAPILQVSLPKVGGDKTDDRNKPLLFERFFIAQHSF